MRWSRRLPDVERRHGLQAGGLRWPVEPRDVRVAMQRNRELRRAAVIVELLSVRLQCNAHRVRGDLLGGDPVRDWLQLRRFVLRREAEGIVLCGRRRVHVWNVCRSRLLHDPVRRDL